MSKEIRKIESFGDSELDAFAKELGFNPDEADKLLEEEQKEDKRKEEEAKEINIMGLVDATGSMTSVWDKTKKIITELIQNMSQYGNIKMKWVAYRDYDAGQRKLLEWSSWTKDPQRLIAFFNQIECRWGEDVPEAVEAGLDYARKDPRKKTVFLIGDAPPHPEKDWRRQSLLLAEQNTKVYSFVVGSGTNNYVDPDAIKYFEKISKITGGVSCVLKSLDDILAVLSLIISKQVSEESFNETVMTLKAKNGGKLPPRLDNFSNLLRLGE